MIQTTLIAAVLEWERRLEIEDERRKANRLEPYRELPTDFEPVQKGGESFWIRTAKFGQNRKNQQSIECYPAYCQETQPG